MESEKEYGMFTGTASGVPSTNIDLFDISREIHPQLTRKKSCRSLRQLWQSYFFSASQLVGILKEYSAYYNENRTHLSLNKDSPLGRKVESEGRVVSVPKVGGLHHVFRRVAA